MTRNPGPVPETFWRELAAAPDALLLLDYDGTLAPFRAERDAARPWPGVGAALARVAAGRTRLVLISGRGAREAARLLGLEPAPEIWGVHGRERLLPDGTLSQAAVAPGAAAFLEAAAGLLARDGLLSRCEAKSGALALHWRGLAAAEALRVRRAARKLEPAARAAGLCAHDFDGGIEFRVTGIDKGGAVRALLEAAGPETAVAFLGDDRTDEDGFAALAARGLTVLVGARPRPTRARHWLRPPGELLRFLERWAVERKAT